MTHVSLDRGKHVKGGAKVERDKGVFDAEADLDELVEKSYGSKPVGPNDKGFYERNVNAGTLVGVTSEVTGSQPTSWFKLVQGTYGSVRTMYPISKPVE
ncbi:hypothetical protein ACFVXC_00080 [Streptomyces sp. NPDC058257]|uniref:hypothetical protein n=1 Tax=Streptomyces sp. NPDC058257 TaxID=3346409 RepID=UPI0036E126CF